MTMVKVCDITSPEAAGAGDIGLAFVESRGWVNVDEDRKVSGALRTLSASFGVGDPANDESGRPE